MDEYHELAQCEVNHLGRYAVGRVYDEHSGATLAATLHCCQVRDSILEMQDEQEHLVHTTEAIAEFVHRYYIMFYMAQSTTDDNTTTDYLTHIVMKWFTNDQKESLMAPLEPVEV
ncbi:hypothetical protein NDU88_005499 [Pleurodeles waltl]|uniref:Uncharacterized protein n=1 Tax=Pleurodeles waltl TaxID=8319 RepID=A0AAV7WUW0_PLEWA|nr:hypothetical protein NDU88_005499 [Pleurodeles waltl]